MSDAPTHELRRPCLKDAQAALRAGRLIDLQPQAPWLHQEVARRMAERLGLLARKPLQVLDCSGRAEGDAQVLRQALPGAQVLVRGAPRRAAGWRSVLGVRPPVHFDDVAQAGQGQMLWSNMQLHWTPSPMATFKRWHEALAAGGLLFFSTLGPGTLQPLQVVFGALGWPPPMAPFDDMHDLGDALVQSGFADPVMDQEVVTLTWPDAASLLAELRTLGRNVHVHRAPGLRGRSWQRALAAGLEGLRRADGRLHLPFELVYGHATRAGLRARMEGTTQVSLEQMRRMVRGA